MFLYQCTHNVPAYITHTHTHTCIYYLDLRFTVSGDVENVERRIIFENGATRFTREVTISINMQSCIRFKAYVRVSVHNLMVVIIMV